MQEDSFNNISKHDLHNAIRKIVRSDNLSDLTAGGVRKKLSDYFNTPREYMDTRAQEVSSLINEVLREIAISSDITSNSSNNSTDSVHEDDLLKLNTENTNHNSTMNTVKGDTTLKSDSTLKVDTVKSDVNVKTDTVKSDVKAKSGKVESPVKREREESLQNESSESFEPPRRVSRLQRDMMTKDFFMKNAKSIEIKLQESDPIFAIPRLFSTGSCGWNCNGKIKLKIGDQDVYCQVGFNCTVVGSKNWAD
ncbi:hypothetical protein TpMuguga_02g00533 [Theileria parva strain Muguga]|uniref:DEK-C domain-containing protein n=1 Tax=Theileria parva TaxID=5875 RepID=Q4N4V7_THEPA|nr:uncharacterized protein TpMuguga_02g00533 [Theileria parva strain Muguga]EAN32816.1 hypothetical protein TpMuguga_02g00533 [Theileria parva strain Muguga]|eukprot:XP_765099.1 hypothetical protein [Theileria parva strain Muguga]